MAERALLVWPHIEKYVTTTLSGQSKISVIRSFQNLKEHVLDPLSTAKPQFFVTTAKVLTPFLKKFQSEEPMLPLYIHTLHYLPSDFRVAYAANSSEHFNHIPISPTTQGRRIVHNFVDTFRDVRYDVCP